MNNELKPLSPFKDFCIKFLGYIPSSYDECYTYLECLEYTYTYLKNQVVPSVNAQNEVIQEMKDYIDNYFDNLDVQQEINNKLDEMALDGTLTNLISGYVDPIFQDYQADLNGDFDDFKDEVEESITNFENDIEDNMLSFKSDVNDELSDFDDRLSSVSSGAPLVASNTSEMTDTSKIYVNTTDGKWYYYNDNAWVIGGTYQATQLANNSIDILQFNDDLQDNYFKKFGGFIDLGTLNSGFTTVNADNEVQITASSGYSYAIIDLDYNKLYIWNGINTQYVRGLIITNSNDKVIYDSGKVTSGHQSLAYMFVPKSIGCKAYLCFQNTSSGSSYIRYIGGTLRKMSDLSSSFKIQKEATQIVNYPTAYFDLVTNQASEWYKSVRYNTYNNASATVYQIEKGKTYVFEGYDFYSVRGVIFTDENFEFIDGSNTGTTSLTPVTKTYVALEDGFAFCHNILNNGYTFTSYIPSIKEISNEIKQDIEINQNNVGFDTWYAIGDSITEVNYRCLYNYLYWINQDIPNLTITNLGISGTGYKNNGGTHNSTFTDRLDSISSYNMNNTIITVMGSINDIQYVQNNLGQLGDTTNDTVYGSIYLFFNTLFTKFNGVRVGVISPLNWKNSDTSTDLDNYCKALEDTCKLFHVPYLDIRDISNLRPNNGTFLNTYYEADGTGNEGQIDTGGVHPNSAGHHLFYGRIKDFISRL